MNALQWKCTAYRITLAELCKKAGVSLTIASRWNRGMNVPSMQTIARLEAALLPMERQNDLAGSSVD